MPAPKPNRAAFSACAARFLEGGQCDRVVRLGSHEVNISWKDGKLTEAVVRTRFDGPIEAVGEPLCVMCGDELVKTKSTNVGFVFAAKGGKTYRLTPQE